ncbi:hypothetical protein N658DRAFT_319742 [Parathielavia hyrcaniae]|uniref:Uncharacterized protein n=1 Tax=Parathielavia hyrcaniae TaxID=113614 RepID=A0AAN6PS26_9PEZI|nr:hypothetical protein N658DRAFT_319742 [Parathielavia hyrcaniae]
MAIHCIQISIGLWQLIQHRPEVLWAAPAAIHFTDFILALMCLFQYRIGSLWENGNLRFLRLACWVVVSFVAFSLSVVGAVRGWDFLHLIQCVLCVAAGLEHVSWKWSRRWWGRQNVLLSIPFRCRGLQSGISQQAV